MISLLISVYAGERSEFLDVALQSIKDQTDIPDEIILIKDGPVGLELDFVISKFSSQLNIKVLTLTSNIGLAKALNIGLKEAQNPWVMRFDSDDFCCRERVALQRELILGQKIDLFGSQIDEFDNQPSRTSRTRQVPTSHDEILIFAKKRNPFNHMTVCYRKDLALQCGGYPDIPYMEDYALWIKMLAMGAKTMNMPNSLVKARVGNGMIRRRGGLKYVKSDAQLQLLMVRLKFKSRAEAVSDFLFRSIVFLLPSPLRAFIYRFFLRRLHNL